MNAKTEAAVRQHGERLQEIFPKAAGMDPVKLCRRLRRLEREGNALGVRLCNGPEFPGGYDEADAIGEKIIDRVDALLGFRAAGVPVFLNLDPRGYALKINDEWLRDNDVRLLSDWGGYGIIAPDLTA